MYRNILAGAVLMQTVEAEQSVGSGSTRAKVADKDYDPETGDFWFEFSNGHVIKENINNFPQHIVLRNALHGVMQKGGDSYAGVKGNVQQAIQNVQGVLDAMKAGNWSEGREGGGGPRLGELAEAIAKLKGCTVEEARTALESADDNQRKTIRNHAQIKATIAEIRAERARQELANQGQQPQALVIPGLG